MDAITKQRIAALWPELARRWVKVDDKLVSMGITVRVDQGLRTWSEQDADWLKGRNPDGSYIDPVHHTGVVTNAKGGQSWHNYGLALDFVPMLNGHPQWNRAFPWYAITIGIAEGWGFISGSKWANPDFPHLQITAPFPEAEPDDYCKALWHGGGDAAVWAEMNKYRSIPL